MVKELRSRGLLQRGSLVANVTSKVGRWVSHLRLSSTLKQQHVWHEHAAATALREKALITDAVLHHLACSVSDNGSGGGYPYRASKVCMV